MVRFSKIIFYFSLFLLFLIISIIFFKKKSIEKITFRSIPIKVLSQIEKKIYQTDLETYLIGVVAAEMPAEFELEALKAQAVASRTIAVKRLKRYGGRGSKHNSQVDFTDDPADSQAWISQKGMIRKWGQEKYQKYYSLIKKAVFKTYGIVITYQNKPIDAVFHSTCGVGTLAAVKLWKNDLPYLAKQSCGFDTHSPRFKEDKFFTWNELARNLQMSPKELTSLKVLNKEPRGRINTLLVGQKRMKGSDFRRLLKLNSTCITWRISKKGICFTTIGYGHGVGMCQYGADGMAQKGYNYRQILKHYYRGIEFRQIKY